MFVFCRGWWLFGGWVWGRGFLREVGLGRGSSEVSGVSGPPCVWVLYGMVAFRGLGLEEWSLGEVGLGGASFEVSRVSDPSLGVGSVGNGVLRLVWGVIDISTRSENIKHEDLLEFWK